MMEQQLLPEIELYQNRNLFADHYLENLLPKDESWQVDEDKLRLAMMAIQNTYQAQAEDLPSMKEAQLERHFIRPVLEALGHVFEVQPSLPTAQGTRYPDYAFFAGDNARRDALKQQGKKDFFKNALAIGDAKHWGRPLDKKLKGPGDPFVMGNPSWQTDHYLRMTECSWAILTDGHFWRLYNRETSYRLDIYYQIDLPQILAARDIEAFKYYYLFFRREAFLPLEEKECFLNRVYKGSLEYAKAVGEDLKENVYSALRFLAQGFLDYPDNRLDAEHDLEEVHQNALTYLYRLLFICYAEDRLLLPRNNHIYRSSYGLVSIEGEVGDKIDRKKHLSPVHTRYWDHLSALFRLINEGSEKLGIYSKTMYVPPYNGGLFDPEKHPFLEKHRVADINLARVIDLLSRSEMRDGSGKGFVDYSSIDVRHLGSIYEGLLEYKLRVAERPMVAIKSRGKENWAPAKGANGKKVVDQVEAGKLYLVTDRGERKATGSFYTPDYIVKYIVENTLGPLIEARMKEEHPIEGILSLKVLDPAMGSGHFLVEATDRLGHGLIEALGGSPDAEDDIRWARREVVERCIYGVDLNPLAVELAKLSLWLHTVAEGKPLNFLDHHLKGGNSLIGAWVEDLGSLPAQRKRVRLTEREEVSVRQMNLLEQRLNERLPVMLGKVLEISKRPTETLEDIRAKEAADQAIEELKAPFKAVADLWVSTYFGHEVAEEEYQEALQHIGESKKLLGLPTVQRAMKIAEERPFFHWELEFPEVFYEDSKRRENAGFDAVVGNPPWGTPDRKMVFWTESDSYDLAKGQFDYWDLFLDKSLSLCKRGGRHSFVVPDSVVQPEHRPARALLIEMSTPSTLVRIGEGSFESVFRGAFIYGTSKSKASRAHQVQTLRLNRAQRDSLEASKSSLASLMQDHGESMPISWFADQHEYEFELGISAVDRDIMLRMEKHGIDWAEAFWDGRGVELGKEGLVVRCGDCGKWMPKPRRLDDARYDKVLCRHCGANLKTQTQVRRAQIVGPERLNELWRPFIVGEAVNRYHISELLYIDTSYEGINYKDDSFYVPPKLLVRKTGVGIYATIDRSNALTNQVVFIFKKLGQAPGELDVISLEYVLGLLSSRAILYYYAQRFGEKEWRSYPYVTQAIIKKLPIPNPFEVGVEAIEAHDRITELVSKALDAQGPISKSFDIEIEEAVMNLYGLGPSDRDRILEVLNKIQKLKIVRELTDQ